MQKYDHLDTKAEKVERTEKTFRLRDSTAKQGVSICGSCGRNQDCALPQPPDGSALRECIHFQHPIVFMKATGLDGEHYNTMRLGESWSKRLRAGDSICLVLKKRGAAAGLYRLCSAVITHVLHTDREMAVAHCQLNHMLMEGELAAADRPTQIAAMRKILDSSYGTNISKRYTTATIIYLKPNEL